MPWSDGVIKQFDVVDLYTKEESDFYGPFNTLLFELFPTSEHYQVSPPFKRVDGSLDFTIQFIIRRRRAPVLFIEIRSLCSLQELSARSKADDQMRQRFEEFASGTISIPTFYGIPAFGPQFCIYIYDPATGDLNRPQIVRNPARINDVAPKNRWAYNLLEEAGEVKFREIVAAVKVMASAL